MTQEVINVGVNADDGNGDSLYESGNKINNNFEDFFNLTPVKADIKFFGNNITARQSNADIDVHPSGTGSILFPGIRFNDNNIEAINTNDDLRISANGSGRVIIAGLGFGGTTISSDDSTSVNINENVIVDGSGTFGGTFAFSGAQTFITGTTFGDLTFANGSITSSSGAISFGNENLTTTGTFQSGPCLAAGNILLDDGSITDSSGAISFGNENISTTGTISGGTGSTFGNLTLANGSITDSSGSISFGNENLTTTATSIAINSTLTVANGSITDSTGAISFGNENVTTSGTIARATGSVIGNLTLANGSITDSSGAISFDNENLSTSTSMAINSTLTVGSGSITDSTGAFTFVNENLTTTGTIVRASGSTIGNLTFANGSITDSSGAISFGNENLATTATSIAINSTLTVANGSITDSTGAISFGNENVTTTGTIVRATGSTIGNLTFANGSITDSSGTIDFGNENLSTSASSMAIDSTLTAGSGSITDSTGAFTFVNENLSTTGTLNVDGLSTFGSISVSGETSFADSITVDNLTFNDNIISSSSNADIRLSPGGTGVVNVANLTIDSSMSFTDNVIKVTNSNSDFVLSGSSSGLVQISNIDLDGGTIDNVIIGANEPAAGNFDPLNFSTLVIPTKITFSGNTISTSRSNDNLEFEANGSGNVVINGLALPNADGQTGQFLQTDGSGNLTFVGVSISFSESTIQDARNTIGNTTEIVLDANLSTGENESITADQSMINDFDQAKYDSAWYIALSRLEGADSAIEFQMQKHIIAQGTDDGSTFDAFSGSSQIVRTSNDEAVTLSSDIRDSSGKVRLLGQGGTLQDGSTTSTINTLHFFRIGLGDNDSSGAQAGSTTFTQQQTLLVADLDSAVANLDTWDVDDYRGAKYFVSINNTTTNEVSSTELLVVHNDTNAFITEYNTIITNAESTPLATFTADISGGNVRLRGANGTAGTCRVTMYRVLLSDTESARSGTPIAIVGSTAIGQLTTTELDANITTVSSRQGFETAEILDEWASSALDSAWYLTLVKDMTSGRLAFHKYSVLQGTSDDSSIEAFITDSSVVRSEEFDCVTADVGVDDGNIQLKLTGISDGSTTISNFANSYRIGLGDNTSDSSTGAVESEGGVILAGNSETTIDHVTASGTTQGALAATRTGAEFTAGIFDSAWYHVITRDLANGSFETQKLSIMHNLQDAFLTSSSVNRTDVGDTHPTFDADLVSAGDSTSKVRLRVTDGDGSSVGPSNTLAYYRIGLGDDDSTGYTNNETDEISINKAILSSTLANVDTFAAGANTAAKYYISINNMQTGEMSNMEALVTHDNTNAYITTYNEHFSGNNSLVTFTADIDSNNVRLRGTATAGGGTRVTVYRILLGDTEGAETGTNTKTIANVTVSSSATQIDTFEDTATDAAHYIVSGQNGANEKFVCELTVITDGTGVFVSQGPNVSTKGTDMLSFTATHDGSNSVVLNALSTSGGSTLVNAYRMIMKAPAVVTATMDTFVHADYRGAKYYMSATSTANSGTMNSEAMVVHDGTTAYITVSNEVFSHSRLFTITADISGDDVVITATPLVANTTIKFYKIRLADDQSAATPRNSVDVISAVTVSSSATTIDTFSTNTHAGAHYIIIGSASDGKSIMEATVISDGTEASVSEGLQVSTKGTAQLELTASHSSTTTTLQASSTSGGSTTVNAYKISFTKPSGTQYTEIDSFAHANTQGALYVAVTNQADAKAQIDELMVVTDGTDAYNLQFGINTDSATTDLVTWDTVVDGNNVDVRAQLVDSRAQGTITAWQVHLDRGPGNPSNIATLDTFDKTTHRGAFYNVSISDANSGTLGNYEALDVRVTHDGTTPYVSVFGRTSSSNTDLTTITADVDGDNIRLRGQISSSNTHEITVVRRLIEL